MSGVLLVCINEETQFDHDAFAWFYSILNGTFEDGDLANGGSTETYFPYAWTRVSSARLLFGNSWLHTTASCSCDAAKLRQPTHYGDTNSIVDDNWPASCFTSSEQISTVGDQSYSGIGGPLLTITAFSTAITKQANFLLGSFQGSHLRHLTS